MHAAGGDADQHIARLHRACPGQDGVALHRAHGKSGQIEIALGVEAGHFRGLAADQGAAGFLAGARDAFHHDGGGVHVQLAGGVIVEKEKRLRALHHDVVDAHGDQILADAVKTACVDGELELGADAVGARHQDGVLEAGRLKVEQPAKAAQVGVGAAPARGPRGRADALDQRLAGVDIHARVFIGQAVFGVGHGDPFRAPVAPAQAGAVPHTQEQDFACPGMALDAFRRSHGPGIVPLPRQALHDLPHIFSFPLSSCCCLPPTV